MPSATAGSGAVTVTTQPNLNQAVISGQSQPDSFQYNGQSYNGSDVKLRGQGPRTEADAAHGVHACESRDAGRAPPCGFYFPRRLGRRTEAGPRQASTAS